MEGTPTKADTVTANALGPTKEPCRTNIVRKAKHKGIIYKAFHCTAQQNIAVDFIFLYEGDVFLLSFSYPMSHVFGRFDTTENKNSNLCHISNKKCTILNRSAGFTKHNFRIQGTLFLVFSQ